MRFSITPLWPVVVLFFAGACATPEAPRVPPPASASVSVSPNTPSKPDNRPKAPEAPARKAEPPPNGKEAKTGSLDKSFLPAALSVDDIQAMAEQQVLCSRYIGPSALEDAMRQASIIRGKSASDKTSAAKTYRLQKPLRFLDLPVASVSFSGNGDPKKAAFWMTLDVPVKTVAAAVQARKISLTKDIRHGYVLASEPRRGQRVELHALPKQSMVLCARAVT